MDSFTKTRQIYIQQNIYTREFSTHLMLYVQLLQFPFDATLNFIVANL